MKRKLQDEQWAKALKDWENNPTSEPWDRPTAGGWDSIVEELPQDRPKRIFAWWKTTGVLLLAASIIGGVYFVIQFDNSTVVENLNENVLINKTENDIIENADFLQKGKQINKIADQYSKKDEQNKFSTTVNSTPVTDLSYKVKEKQFPESKRTDYSLSPVNAISPPNAMNDEEKGVSQKVTPRSTLPGSIPRDQVFNEKEELEHSIQVQQIVSPNAIILNQRGSKVNQIQTLKFEVNRTEKTLVYEPIATQKKSSPWSMDIYTHKALASQRLNISPFIDQQKESSHNFGIQVNRKLNKGLGIQLGVQRSSYITKTTSRFLRNFDPSQETPDGDKRISEFNLSTSLGSSDPIDDNVKIERDDDQLIEDQTRLIFKLERKFVNKSISIPIQLSYNLWSQYPFQLSGIVGAVFSKKQYTIERSAITIINPEFRIRQFRPGSRPIMKVNTSDVALQAGLRLGVQLNPKWSAITQVSYQGYTSTQPAFFNDIGGGQVRLGLSYQF